MDRARRLHPNPVTPAHDRSTLNRATDFACRWPARRRLRAAALCVAACAGVGTRSLTAQVQGGQDACEEGRISDIFIDAHSVFDVTDPDLDPRFAWAYRTANGLHVATREAVIRRELLVQVGDCYRLERLRDSERLVRELLFIADADVFGVRQPDGSIHVVVDTRDEWSTRIEPRIRSSGGWILEGIRVREDNLLGTGRHVSAFYINDRAEQVYGAAYANPQLLGTRWDVAAEGGRTPLGSLLRESLTYPFVGQVGRWAIRQAVSHNDRYFEYFMPESDRLLAVWYPERREWAELGVAHRWGRRGLNRTLLGASLIGEWSTYPGEPRLAEGQQELVAGPVDIPPVPMDSISSVRLMVMTGQRNIDYVRQHALDTVNGTEDVRIGVEAEVAMAPTIAGLSTDRDLSLDIGLFAAGRLGERFFAGGTLVAEARRDQDSGPEDPEWRDVFGELDAWAYWRPGQGTNQTIVAALTAAGGWHNRVPFQLTIGGESGLRGFPDHVDPGGRRIVTTLEARSYLGWPLPQLLDLGSVAFVDAGRIWAGDVAFGRDSEVRANVGIGLRAAFPPGSRRTFRLDFGVPVTGGARGLQVTIGVGQRVGHTAPTGDPQILRSTPVRPFTSFSRRLP